MKQLDRIYKLHRVIRARRVDAELFQTVTSALITRRRMRVACHARASEVKAFLKNFSGVEEDLHPAVGIGEDIRVESKTVVGAGFAKN